MNFFFFIMFHWIGSYISCKYRNDVPVYWLLCCRLWMVTNADLEVTPVTSWFSDPPLLFVTCVACNSGRAISEKGTQWGMLNNLYDSYVVIFLQLSTGCILNLHEKNARLSIRQAEECYCSVQSKPVYTWLPAERHSYLWDKMLPVSINWIHWANQDVLLKYRTHVQYSVTCILASWAYHQM